MTKQFVIKFKYRERLGEPFITDKIKIQASNPFRARKLAVKEIKRLLNPYEIELK